MCCPQAEPNSQAVNERLGFGNQQIYRPTYQSTYQSPYRPQSALSYNDYMTHYRPPSSSAPSNQQYYSQNQYRPSTSSLYNLFNYQTTNRPTPSSTRRFTESDLPPAGRCGNQARDRIFGNVSFFFHTYTCFLVQFCTFYLSNCRYNFSKVVRMLEFVIIHGMLSLLL